jgi:SOUL heme-binding protein
MATEEPKFTSIEKSGEFELRQYEPIIVAETFVRGTLDEASSGGFRLIASYIFGNNKSRTSAGEEKIAMTVPVSVEPISEKIAMTRPVTVEHFGDTWRVYFVMPSSYTMSTLPYPKDTRVSLREIGAQKKAVIIFSGFAGEEKVRVKTDALLEWMKLHQLEATSTAKLARYNPPWTLPFIRRNEVLISYRP